MWHSKVPIENFIYHFMLDLDMENFWCLWHYLNLIFNISLVKILVGELLGKSTKEIKEYNSMVKEGKRVWMQKCPSAEKEYKNKYYFLTLIISNSP